MGEAVDVARRVLGLAGEPVWDTMPARVWDTDTWVADARKVRAALGWSARRTFADGLMEMIAWFKQEPAARERYEAAWPATGQPQSRRAPL